MEVIFEKTISKGVGDRLNIAGIQREEVMIVSRFYKKILSIVATIVDVIVAAVLEWSWFEDGTPMYPKIGVAIMRSGRFLNCETFKP